MDETPRTTPPSSRPSPRPVAETPILTTSIEAAALMAKASAKRSPALRTMWPRMSRLCPPRRGRLWIVGGSPGNYKTQTILNLALDMALLRQRVLFVSLEQETHEIGALALARFSRVATRRLAGALSGDELPLTEDESKADGGALVRLSELHLNFRIHGAEKLGRAIEDVLSTATAHNYDAVFLDHVGLVDMGRGNPNEQVTAAVGTMRMLARGQVRPDYRPLVVVATPLNREGVKESTHDETRLPKTSDFRGTSDLEYHADVAMILQKDKQPEDYSGPDIVNGFVLKQRSGRAPLVLRFEGDGAMGTVVEHHPNDPPPPTHYTDREPGED